MAFTKINAAGIGTTETVTVDGLTVINDGSFGGNLTVSGVLTYEDVTNVDSVGLITARNGIVVGSGITLSKDGDIFATGITTVSGNVKVGTGITLSPDGDGFFTGIVTATTFSGALAASNLTGALPAISGANLTNLDASDLASGTVPTARLGSGTASSSTFLRGDSTFAAVTSTTINSNADNRVITGSGTANTLNGESNLTFDGNALTVTNSSSNTAATFQGAGGAGFIAIKDGDDSTVAYIGVDGGNLKFQTSGSSYSDKLLIKSNGEIGIGTDQTTSALQIYAANDGEGTATGQITLKDTAAYNGTPTAGIVFQGHHASNNSQAIFAGIRGFKANTGDGDYDGCLAFDVRTHGSVAFEAMRIDEHGRMGLKTTSPDATLHIGGPIDSHPVLLLQGGSSSTGDLTVPAAENLQIGHWDSSSNTYTNRFQINTSTGNVTMPSQACMVFVDPVDISTVSNANGHNLDPIHFNTQHINQGGVSSSNTKSRITVPTAGTYLIQGLLSGSLTTASAGDGIQIKIKRNGSVYPDGNMWPAEGMGDFAGKEYAFSFSVPVTLALNDYVELCYDNIGGSIQYNLAYGYFAVTLLH